ncbi:DUF952 domain-containing protein [Micromonospora purpureochromogenes]|uniref:Uncharacterized conserved protein, DUF952 family n=1 Tax=Micromonospora purpureochromogenes TaxID=47872 RepID=A0A1C4ZKT8_9ACTN|nr:DUF952 domain-containing protein [Micromonospora purpureochromogenes]NYF58203.1 uncharacterized protein (DUF952 family) [Micromonospora purpureochromogenes]SCF33426.1 Uncharacterized conserved protein, DUF952 family [Micromonospora purpureochromogenes]
MIYKLVTLDEWARAEVDGYVPASALDRQDGFLHLSAADQIVETARRHYAGATGLALLTVEEDRLGDDLRWEPSRDGARFPHLYGALPLAAVTGVAELPADVPAAEAVADLLR